jgi:Ca2+-binding RTX toxin-like protein
MVGGAGDDTYVVDGSTDIVVEAAGAGTDAVSSSFTFTLGANVENLTLTGSTAINGTGSGANNTITGNAAANILLGGLGNDTLNGAAGNDSLDGGSGNDTLDGGTGNNTLLGGAGNDGITGNAGVDLITGGAGADTIATGNGLDVLTVADGTDDSSLSAMDVYSDLLFTAGVNLDKFNFTTVPTVVNTGVTASGILEADLATALNVAGGAGFNTATAGDISAAIVTVGAGSYLAVDSNGDDTFTASDDFIVEITGATGTLTTASFI